MESSLAKDSLQAKDSFQVEGSSGDAVVVALVHRSRRPVGWSRDGREGGGGGGVGETIWVELTGVGAGRGLCPLPPSHGGALEAPSSEPGAEPQKLCKKTFIFSIIRPPPTLSFAVGCQHNS